MAPCMSRNKALTHLLLPLGLSLGLFSCQTGNVHLTSYVYAYGTTWEIHLYEGEQRNLDDISSFITSSSRVLDLEASECRNGIYALNSLGQVDAHPFLLEAIQLGLKVEKDTHEAYSITVGELSAAWLTALEEGHTLERETVDNLLGKAKGTSLIIEGEKVTKVGGGTIDLGSLGKGLCLDHVASYLKEKSITKYLINGGTSSLLIGENHAADGKTKVSLIDAKKKAFYAKNEAISVSSISRQSYEIGGVTYSHIVDPRTGVPALENDALCLRGQDASLLDAYSTAYLVLGEDYLSELDNKGIAYCLMKGGEVQSESQGFFA